MSVENDNSLNDEAALEELSRTEGFTVVDSTKDVIDDQLLHTVTTSLPKFYFRNADGDVIEHNEDDQGTELTSNSRHEFLSDDELPSVRNSCRGSVSSTAGSISSNQYLSPSKPGTPDSVRQIHSLDRRFKTRLSSISSTRSISSSLGGHLRSASELSNVSSIDDIVHNLEQSTPWEAVRWTKLRKISNQLYAEASVANYGRSTAMMPCNMVIVGTSRGLVLVFDYHQNLKTILGLKTKALEYGEVTALAISADQMHIGAGYSTGHILTWDLNRTSGPHLHIPPITPDFTEKPVYDGHINGSKVVHLSFSGTRHSALVSGDVTGMAFSHSVVRTIVGRKITTRRILGRYATKPQPKNRKPTAILACNPLPLSSYPQLTDIMGLVAVMNPQTLIIVSVNPRPETQLKISRNHLASNTMGVSACQAWLPTTSRDSLNGQATLAYCWSNIVNILDISAIKDSITEDISLRFSQTKKYVGTESIVVVQWISNKVLALVTITQRLLILNIATMTASASVDLLTKHIMHHDYFSGPLRELSMPDSDSSNDQPTVVADAFFNSLKVYKERIFLMGMYEFVVGSLSNWADRLLDVMESEDYKRAINLATSYYLGTDDLLTIGLPENDEDRHEMINKSLPDMIYTALSQTANKNNNEINRQFLELDVSERYVAVRDLIQTCLTAAIATQASNSLIGDIHEQLEQTEYRELFFELLASFIVNGEVSELPPDVFKDLVSYIAAIPDSFERLEEIICNLDTQTLDLDFSLSLCRQHNLTDTKIYIWNNAFQDFISPLADFIEEIRQLNTQELEFGEKQKLQLDAEKAYAYISYISTGRSYPTGLFMQDEFVAFKAKCMVYYFILSGSHLSWPRGSSTKILTSKEDEVNFPYIVELIEFNSSLFFAALNEAFEDSFLNDVDDSSISISSTESEEVLFGRSINRQFIVNILVECVLNSDRFNQEVKLVMSVFIARNYPKYSQFLILPGKILSEILESLVFCNIDEWKESSELAIISLLSKYKPPDLNGLVDILTEAKLYSVLQFLFRSEKQYAKLLEVSFKSHESESGGLDSDHTLLDILEECLNHTKDYTDGKEKVAIESMVVNNFAMLVEIDCSRFVELLSKHAHHLHEYIFKLNDEDLQFRYLQKIFSLVNSNAKGLPGIKARHLYISLLAKRNQTMELHKLFSNLLISKNDVDLVAIVDDLIEYKCIDILALILRRQNRFSEAMIYLVDHLIYLYDEYQKEEDTTRLADLEQVLSRYVYICFGLCQDQEAAEQKFNNTDNEIESTSEQLWIKLIGTLMDFVRVNEKQDAEEDAFTRRNDFVNRLLREAFTSLLSTTGRIGWNDEYNRTILRIFRSVLIPSSTSPVGLRTVGTVRPILNDLFAAYRYQYTMISMAKQVLDNDTYEGLLELMKEKLRGWRVSKTGECESCGRKVIGVGINAEWLYSEWEKEWKQKEELEQQQALHLRHQHANHTNGKSRKGKEKSSPDILEFEDRQRATERLKDEVLVVFKCGHTYHIGCLRNLGYKSEFKCAVCD